MSTLQVNYSGQLALASAVAEETIDIREGDTVLGLVSRVAKRHGEAFQKLVFQDDGSIECTLFMALDGEQVTDLNQPILVHHRELMLMPPIAGG
jgi:molybdopterin converting factor small subunit